MDMPKFRAIFGRPMITDGLVFFREPEARVTRMRESFVKSMHLPATLNGETWPIESVMSRGPRERLVSFKKDILKRRKRGATSKNVNFNLSQHPKRSTIGRSIPCLLKNSLVYNSQRRRPLCAEGHLEVQGMPFWDDVSGVPACPFKTLVESRQISNTALKKLTGNSMHVASVAASVLSLLAFTKRVGDP